MANYVLGKDLKGPEGFIRRIFERGMTPQEFGVMNTISSSQYENTFGKMQVDFLEALSKDEKPESFAGSQEEWNVFRNDELGDQGKPFAFSASKTAKVFGEDYLKTNLPKNLLEATLKTQGDDPNSTKRFDIESTLSNKYQGEDGKDNFDPIVRTNKIGEDGSVQSRSNNLTSDASNQAESGDAGVGGIDWAQMDALIEAGRLELVDKSGGRVKPITDNLNQAFYKENVLEGLYGSREDSINTVDNIAQIFREQGYTVKDGKVGTPGEQPTTTGGGPDTSLQAEEDRSIGIVGAYRLDPNLKTTQEASKVAASYKSGTIPSDGEIEQLSLGLSSGFRSSFKRNLTSTRDAAERLTQQIQTLESQDELSPGQEAQLKRLKTDLANQVKSIDRSVERVTSNIQSDVRAISDKEELRVQDLSKKLSEKMFVVGSGTATDARVNDLNKGIVKDLRQIAGVKFRTISNDKKPLATQILSNNANLEQIQKNPVVFNDLINLTGEEFLSKYSTPEGKLNARALFGQELPPEAEEALDRSINKKLLTELSSALESGDENKVKELLNSVNISEQDQITLGNALRDSGGDFRKAPRNKFRALYFATIANMDTESDLFKKMITPGGIYANMVEMGMLDSSGIDNSIKLSNQRIQENLSRKASPEVMRFKNDLNDLYDKVLFDEDLDFGNEDVQTEVNKYIQDMKEAAFGSGGNASDISLYLTARADVIKRGVGEVLDSPGFLKELFSLGFARGIDKATLDLSVPVNVVRDSSGAIIGFRANNAFKRADFFKRVYGPDFVEELAAIAIDRTGGRQLNEAEGTR